MGYNIGFIGAGNMAFALIQAIRKAHLAKHIIASDTKQERLDEIKKQTGADTTLNNNEVVERSDIIFIAVKPQVIDDVLKEIKDTDKLIISIAAGIKTCPWLAISSIRACAGDRFSSIAFCSDDGCYLG